MILLLRQEQRETTDGDLHNAVWQPTGSVYHCFDRIVILGHIPLLTRPENIIHFFRIFISAAQSPKKCFANGPTNRTAGSKLSPGNAEFRWNGPKRVCGKRIMSALICSAWNGRTGSGCTSF